MQVTCCVSRVTTRPTRRTSLYSATTTHEDSFLSGSSTPVGTHTHTHTDATPLLCWTLWCVPRLAVCVWVSCCPCAGALGAVVQDGVLRLPPQLDTGGGQNTHRETETWKERDCISVCCVVQGTQEGEDSSGQEEEPTTETETDTAPPGQKIVVSAPGISTHTPEPSIDCTFPFSSNCRDLGPRHALTPSSPPPPA